MTILATNEATTATALALFGGSDLAPSPDSPEYREHVERGAVELARVFHETTKNLRHHWGEIRTHCQNLDDLFKSDDDPFPRTRFRVDLEYAGDRHTSDLDRTIKKMNVTVWELLINKMGVKNLMSIKRRAEFEEQIKKGDVPDVTAENILGVLMGLADRASEFATESAKETLKLLTPHSARYKTNSGFKVGRRVILTYYVEQAWQSDKFRP